jgi:hypothetical protein
LTSFIATSQNANDFMDEVDKNRIISTVMEFSGEVEVDGIGTILDRSKESGKEKSRVYLSQKFSELGLGVQLDNFIYNNQNGTNIVGEQPGILYPDSIVIICAHYDSVDEYCADDNASGVSAVLEAASVLSEYKFERTIFYALWDLEELGLYGSRDYAFEAYNNGDRISAVFNADMIGYDGNSDLLFEIHSKNELSQDYLYNEITEVLNDSDLELKPKGIFPGITNSDHSSFWAYGYPSVLITQGYKSNDFNPNYHSSLDRIEGISEKYLTQLTKLIIGTASQVAVLDKSTNVQNDVVDINIYYDPITQNLITKNLNIEEYNKIEIIDISGRSIAIERLLKDNSSISLSELDNGVYFIIIGDSRKTISKFIKY